VSIRPVMRMALRPEQLIELILGVTGKHVERVEQILRSGSVAASGFRYWWEAVEIASEDLEERLAAFPDADPARPYEAARCTMVIAEAAGSMNALAEFGREAAARRRSFRRRSFWDALMTAAAEQAPSYRGYSYARRGDLYALELAEGWRELLAEEARQFGVGDVKTQAAALGSAVRLVYVCGR